MVKRFIAPRGDTAVPTTTTGSNRGPDVPPTARPGITPALGTNAVSPPQCPTHVMDTMDGVFRGGSDNPTSPFSVTLTVGPLPTPVWSFMFERVIVEVVAPTTAAVLVCKFFGCFMCGYPAVFGEVRGEVLGVPRPATVGTVLDPISAMDPKVRYAKGISKSVPVPITGSTTVVTTVARKEDTTWCVAPALTASVTGATTTVNIPGATTGTTLVPRVVVA